MSPSNRKKTVAYIAGRSAPPEKPMGHAGAIMGNKGTAEDKIKAFENAGVKVAEKPSDVAALLARATFFRERGACVIGAH